MASRVEMIGEANLLWPSCAAKKGQQGEASQFDYELAQRIAGGDMLAFEDFYKRYHRLIYNLCLRMTFNVAEAEDLTQEIFIHLYHKIGGFRGESRMRTWLHRVTINNVLMHFRKNSVRRERTTEDGESPEPALHYTTSPSQTPSLDRIALERAISRLAPGYRAVFILHDIEGYEHAEVARICGNSVGTSKSQLHKARKKLYELLRGANEA